MQVHLNQFIIVSRCLYLRCTCNMTRCILPQASGAGFRYSPPRYLGYTSSVLLWQVLVSANKSAPEPIYIVSLVLMFQVHLKHNIGNISPCFRCRLSVLPSEISQLHCVFAGLTLQLINLLLNTNLSHYNTLSYLLSLSIRTMDTLHLKSWLIVRVYIVLRCTL